MKYLIDTNIISEIINNPKDDFKVKETYEKKLLNGHELYISGIAYYEIKRGLLYLKNKTKTRKFEKICLTVGLKFLERIEKFDEATDIYVKLKRKGKFKVNSDADILIAATAIIDNLILVTDNEKDFIHINKLKLENWKK